MSNVASSSSSAQAASSSGTGQNAHPLLSNNDEKNRCALSLSPFDSPGVAIIVR